MKHVIAFERKEDLEKGKQAFYAAGMEEENLTAVDRISIPWGDIVVGALVGGAIGAVLMYFAEHILYYDGTFGWPSIYPLMGMVFGLFVGFAVGGLSGWLLHLSRHGDPWPFRKRLKEGQHLLFVRTKQSPEEIEPILKASGGFLVSKA